MMNLNTLITSVAAQVPVQLSAPSLVEISAIAPLLRAQANEVSFLDNQLYKKDAHQTKAAAVFVREADAPLLPEKCVALVTQNPYAAYAVAAQVLNPAPTLAPGISTMAIVSDEADIHPTARIEPNAIIYAGAKVGAGAHIGASTTIGQGVEIGENTKIEANCTVLNCTLGDGCLLHGGVRIGQDGFGFAQNGKTLIKVPQLGRVVIGNDVEVGANSTIDRGALDDTMIGNGTKIDCLVQIGHNVQIGENCRIVAQTGLAGSTVLGDNCVLGGQSGTTGHLVVAPQTMLAGRGVITKSIINSGQVLAGFPAQPIREWRKQEAAVKRLLKRGSSPSETAQAGQKFDTEQA